MMLSFYKKYGRTAFDIGLIILTVYLIMYVFSSIYQITKPIFIGFIIYLLIEPFANFLHRSGLKKSTSTTISMLLFILVALGIAITLGIIFTAQINHLAINIPRYFSIFQVVILKKIEYFQGQIAALPPDLLERVQEYSIQIANKGSQYLSSFFQMLFVFLTSVPTLIFNFIIGLVLAYFLSIEIKDWKKLANEKTPKTFKKAYHFLKENVITGILQYVKAQAKLITFTFIIIFIGLVILRIQNAFAISLLSAFFDVLPVLGVSTVFVPWIIYLFIVGKTTTAIWLTVLLGIVILFRQIAEPKIMGESLGVSAFTMLAFMVISLSLFGVAGVILAPVLMILIKALYDHGYIKQWIHMPKDEYEEQ